MNKAPRDHFQEVIEGFSIAMLVTRTPEAQLRARPMSVAEVRGNGDIWFVTCSDDGKAEEIRDDPNVCVAMTSGTQHISITGHATLDADRERLRSLWNARWQVFYPDGPDADNVVLLKVESSQGEYWDVSGTNGVRYLTRGVAAYFSGDRPKMDSAMHEKVGLAEEGKPANG